MQVLMAIMMTGYQSSSPILERRPVIYVTLIHFWRVQQRRQQQQELDVHLQNKKNPFLLIPDCLRTDTNLPLHAKAAISVIMFLSQCIVESRLFLDYYSFDFSLNSVLDNGGKCGFRFYYYFQQQQQRRLFLFFKPKKETPTEPHSYMICIDKLKRDATSRCNYYGMGYIMICSSCSEERRKDRGRYNMRGKKAHQQLENTHRVDRGFEKKRHHYVHMDLRKVKNGRRKWLHGDESTFDFNLG